MTELDRDLIQKFREVTNGNHYYVRSVEIRKWALQELAGYEAFPSKTPEYRKVLATKKNGQIVMNYSIPWEASSLGSFDLFKGDNSSTLVVNSEEVIVSNSELRKLSRNLNQQISDKVLLIKSKVESDGALSSLHPEVQRISAQPFVNGDYNRAVLNACMNLNEHIRKKLGIVRDANGNLEDGVALMNSVFSRNNPRLQLTDDPEVQDGYRFMFAGVIKCLRNPHAHFLLDQFAKDNAYELLCTLSAMHRLVDFATIC